MQDHEPHLTDDELVLAADDELGRRTQGVRTHLENCPRCRSRAAIFDSVIAQLAQAQKSGLDSELPSVAGPRAALRARISEASVHNAGIASRLGIPSGLFAGALGFAALMAVATVAGVLAFRHSGSRDEFPAPLLSNTGDLPNRDFTPGAARPASLQEICALPHEEVVKEVSPSQRQRVLEEYGIPSARSEEYEVDYLITPGLGGNDDIRNLWPEPYHSATWNAHVKDALEERLHEMVCSHQLDLAVAQKAIATNWIAAYQKYVQPSPTKTRLEPDWPEPWTERNFAQREPRNATRSDSCCFVSVNPNRVS
jgi:hypothetical protein